jgi:hypothetical protein
MRPWAKMAAGVFKYPERFRVFVDTALHFHKSGGMSSAKQFFIDLGKCLSHGTPGARGINPESWDRTDFALVDIALSYDSPISDKDVVRELQNRGHVLRGDLPTLEVRFRKRKHRLILDAYAFLKQSHLKA